MNDERAIVVDWGKLATILMVLGGVTLLAALGVIEGAAATNVYLLAAGYTFGNGRLAAKGGTPQPMISSVPRPAPEAPAADPARAPGPAVEG